MIKDIKEKLIKRLKRTYRECVGFDISDIRKIVDELPEYEFTPYLVDRDINADEDKLFDRNELKKLSVGEIKERTDGAILFDA